MKYVNSKFAVVCTSFLLSTRFYFIQILLSFFSTLPPLATYTHRSSLSTFPQLPMFISTMHTSRNSVQIIYPALITS